MDLRVLMSLYCDSGMESRQFAVKYGVVELRTRPLKRRRRETGETAAPLPQSPACEMVG